MIITEKRNGEIFYNSSSPDEIALANFAKYCGFVYQGMSPKNEITASFNGKDLTFKLLNIIEFDSTRKRQSVIFEDSDGSIWLYTKGADNVILERASEASRSSEEVSQLKIHLDKFAVEGLRTLVLGTKKIEAKVYAKWSKEYEKAMGEMEGKEEKMSELENEIENELEILGATAIEDKLQENVPDVIEQLKRAGIKVWVLTGDKVETAKTIGFSCSLITKDMLIHEVLSRDEADIASKLGQIEKEQKYQEMVGKDQGSALIVSGDALITIFENAKLSERLNGVAQKCSSVLCCRVSPKQKQEVVRLVKKSVPYARTLAIGDGANDVNMITEAHVGVGIKGLEGQQAARSSDFAVGEFQHLRRLMFYYGRDSYRKNSILVLYSFYKNVVLVLPQFWYGIIFTNLSGVTLYDSNLYQLVNIFYTSVPIILYAIFDSDADDEILEFSPKYYFPGPKKYFFNSLVFWQWIGYGAFQAGIITLEAYPKCNPDSSSFPLLFQTGRTSGFGATDFLCSSARCSSQTSEY